MVNPGACGAFVGFGGIALFYFLFEWADQENVRVAVKETFEFFGTIIVLVIVAFVIIVGMDWLRGVF